MKEYITCIRCPLGCKLDIDYDNNTIRKIKGNKCKRGFEYAEKELFNPERIVTTTVRIKHGAVSLLPVKTKAPVAKGKTYEIIRKASAVTTQAPCCCGDTVIRDVDGNGIDLVATRTVKAKTEE